MVTFRKIVVLFGVMAMRCASGSTPHADNCTDDSQGMLQPGTFSLSLIALPIFKKNHCSIVWNATYNVYSETRRFSTIRSNLCSSHDPQPCTNHWKQPQPINSFPHFRLSRKKRNEFLLPIYSNINSAPIFTCLAPFPPTTLAFANRTGMISSYAGFWDALQVDPYAGTQCKLELNII